MFHPSVEKGGPMVGPPAEAYDSIRGMRGQVDWARLYLVWGSGPEQKRQPRPKWWITPNPQLVQVRPYTGRNHKIAEGRTLVSCTPRYSPLRCILASDDCPFHQPLSTDRHPARRCLRQRRSPLSHGTTSRPRLLGRAVVLVGEGPGVRDTSHSGIASNSRDTLNGRPAWEAVFILSAPRSAG